MDTLDIFALPDDTRVIVTVEALRDLFARGVDYGEADAVEKAYHVDRTIKGDIV